ncbi:hypothetical protein BGW38_008480, partial [Lunasporangiospora selenospora]
MTPLNESVVPTTTAIIQMLSDSTPQPSLFTLLIESTKVDVPPYSNLHFRCLSSELQVNIFVFSTRKKTKVFRSEGATVSIGIIQHIDSYLGTKQYLALGMSRDYSIQPPIPREPPTPPHHSHYPLAIYRRGARRYSCSKKRKVDDVADVDVQEAFKRARHEYVATRIKGCLLKGKDKEEACQSLIVTKRLPLNIKKSAFDVMRASNEAAKDLSRGSLDKKLGKDGSINQWNSYVQSNFQSLWEAEEEARAKVSSKGKGRADSNDSTETAAGPSSGGGSSSRRWGGEDDDDDNDDDNGGSDGGRGLEEENGPDLKEYRTCTATLQQILRQDLCAGDKERVRILLEKSQETMTVVSEE